MNGLCQMRDVEAIALENGDQAGVPEEKHGVLDIGRESMLDVLQLIHVELLIAKGTKKERLVLKLAQKRNGMAQDITFLWLICTPWTNCTRTWVYSEVWTEGVHLKMSPGGPPCIGLCITTGS